MRTGIRRGTCEILGYELALAERADGTCVRLLEASRDCPDSRETIALHFERANGRSRGPEYLDPDSACLP